MPLSITVHGLCMRSLRQSVAVVFYMAGNKVNLKNIWGLQCLYSVG